MGGKSIHLGFLQLEATLSGLSSHCRSNEICWSHL